MRRGPNRPLVNSVGLPCALALSPVLDPDLGRGLQRARCPVTPDPLQEFFDGKRSPEGPGDVHNFKLRPVSERDLTVEGPTLTQKSTVAAIERGCQFQKCTQNATLSH